MAQRCDAHFGTRLPGGGWERTERNSEYLGPFDKSEDALNAIRSQWNYNGNFTEFNGVYSSDEENSLKSYKYYPIEPE